MCRFFAPIIIRKWLELTAEPHKSSPKWWCLATRACVHWLLLDAVVYLFWWPLEKSTPMECATLPLWLYFIFWWSLNRNELLCISLLCRYIYYIIHCIHTSKKRGLRSTFWPPKMLQNLPYLWKKKTHVVFFIFHLEQLWILKHFGGSKSCAQTSLFWSVHSK